MKNDTIVAVSTPPGVGAIGIVRVSGPASIEISSKISKLKNGKSLEQQKTHTLSYAEVINPKNNELIDEALITVLRAPNSYTGEDTIEFNMHGSYVVLKQVTTVLLELGLRYAAPGEFTKRAFLNGKLDLAQAEAVAEIIDAKTELSSRIAVNKLVGTLSQDIDKIKQEIIDIISNIETEIEFPEEDVEAIDMTALRTEANKILLQIQALKKHSDIYDVLNEGIRIVITGPPNVGKSSLLNFISKKEKSIVTEIPGTTRDVIEHQINLFGIPAVLYDTAGLRKSENIIEIEGIKRTTRLFDIADIIVVLIDSTEKFDKDGYTRFKDMGKKVIVAVNKVDINRDYDAAAIKRFFSTENVYLISAKTGEGIEKLLYAIKDRVLDKNIDFNEGLFVLNKRQVSSLMKAEESLKSFSNDAAAGHSPEELSVSLKEAIFFLDEILGKNIDERILDNIFSNFCIGK